LERTLPDVVGTTIFVTVVEEFIWEYMVWGYFILEGKVV
jgi:hypothetical protein